jgi:signal transduction histidine kinase
MLLNFPWETALRVALLLASIGIWFYAVFSMPLHPKASLENAFFLLPLAWVLTIVLGWISQIPAWQGVRNTGVILAQHVLYATVAIFLLTYSGLSHALWLRGAWLYALLGVAVLGVGWWLGETGAATVWRVLSFLGLTAVVVGLVLKMQIEASPATALVAVAGLWGLGLVLDGLWVLQPKNWGLQGVHFFYFSYLIALWLLLSGRVDWVQIHSQKPGSHTNGFMANTGFSGVVETQSAQASVIHAIEHERSRIAQDIHDGVGSQLVGLIASLDPKSLQDKRILMGLESCLMDLKMSVDSMNHADTNIFDALGRLRYRLQPSFDRAGIKMLWRVDVAGPLLGIRMSDVSHLVHIVQECFSNILQHSHATKVKLVCHYEAEPEPRLRLEVQDNGIGIAQHQQGEFVGKGMANMLKRAKELGVPLHIGTQTDVGTRVRLYLPVRSARDSAQA